MPLKPASFDSPTIGLNDLQLKRRLSRLATLDDRPLSQLARRFLRKAVDEEEERQGLPDIDQDPNYKAAS